MDRSEETHENVYISLELCGEGCWRRYRRATRGAIVYVPSMPLGNMGATFITKVHFTKNTATGNMKLYSEYVMNAQGADVLIGIWVKSDI